MAHAGNIIPEYLRELFALLLFWWETVICSEINVYELRMIKKTVLQIPPPPCYYYCFVPIVKQSMQVYAVDEQYLNLLCITYALVYVPGAFVTGPIIGLIGCRWTLIVFSMFLNLMLNLFGCAVRCGPQGLIGSVPWVDTSEDLLDSSSTFQFHSRRSPQCRFTGWL